MKIQSTGSTVTSETVIDMAWLETATLPDLMAVLQMAKINPQKLAEVNALLATPEGKELANDMLNDPDYVPKSMRQPSAEEAAQIAADTQLAEQQAAEDAAAAAEDAAAAAAAAAVAPPVVEPVVPVVEAPKPVRNVLEYQVTDDNGQPIGRATHIEYSSEEELITKMRNAHENAMRYAERMKRAQHNQRESGKLAAETQQAQTQATQAKAEAEAATQVVVTEKDPVKIAEAVKKITAAERSQQIAHETARRTGELIGTIWMADHKQDYLPCKANSDVIGQWLKDNQRAFTYENLEEAFAATEHRLAKPVAQAPVEVPAAPVANPPAVAPVVPAAQVAPIVQPAPVAPVTLSTATPPVSTPPVAIAPEPSPAAAPIAQPAARRPGVNGSLPPGTLTAARPTVVQQSQAATKEELLRVIDKMSPEQYRQKLKTSKQFRDQLEAAGIPVAGKAQYGSSR